MADGYHVDPAVLEKDALLFDDWTKVLDKASDDVPVEINAIDFSIIPGAQEVYSAFLASATALRDYIDSGSRTFDGFARTLLTTAKLYMEAEGFSNDDVARIEQELADL
jgi:hypothetical protein